MNPELKRHIEDEKVKARVKEHINGLMKELNVMNNEGMVAEAMLEAVTGEHRTLQQLFMGATFKVINGYADARHDLRNEAAVNVCKMISDKMEDEGVHLPYI